MDEWIPELLMAAMSYLVLLNALMLYSLSRKARGFGRALARYESRDRLKLERDTIEAMALLRTGKIEEARAIANRIVNA